MVQEDFDDVHRAWRRGFTKRAFGIQVRGCLKAFTSGCRGLGLTKRFRFMQRQKVRGCGAGSGLRNWYIIPITTSGYTAEKIGGGRSPSDEAWYNYCGLGVHT